MASGDWPNAMWDLKRECYLVTLEDEDGDPLPGEEVPGALDDGSETMKFQHTHISQITSGDLFTLEASNPDLDPMHGTVTVERIYQAVGNAYQVGNAWYVDAEQM